MGNRYFTPKLFEFLRDLDENNDRDWFKAHQAAYERYVREPALDFINDFADPLKGISEHFVADTRKVGGSLFRIQRDTRFGKDKTPYKPNTGMQFRHAMAKDAHAPGFYLNLQPGECYMGVGLWRPETKVAYLIREKIDADPTRWKRASRGKRFTDVFSLGGDSLIRPPKGFDEDHPLIDDLKRKDFIASTRLTQAQVTSDHFLEDFTDSNKRAGAFMHFLCDAVGVQF
ncbi:MAG: TIGR02453 family protein [Acidimicrobiia bacterium]|nr:TIGR02453 family protein [Acidimicrobiia bacterium]